MRAKNLKHLHMNLLNMSIIWPCRSENELAEAFQHAFRLPVNIQTAAHTWKIRLGHSMESQQFRLKPDHHRLHLQPKPEALFDGGGDLIGKRQNVRRARCSKIDQRQRVP